MLATLGGAVVALVALRLGAAPQILLVISSAAFLQLLLVFPVTLQGKISIHATAVASFAVLMWGLIGPAAAPLAGTRSAHRLGTHPPETPYPRPNDRRHTMRQPDHASRPDPLAGNRAGTTSALSPLAE